MVPSIKPEPLLTCKMVPDSLETGAMKGLCSKGQIELSEPIYYLLSQRISHYISLPLIIFGGDQLSGKSSVLQAIFGTSFLIKTKFCTHCLTNLVLFLKICTLPLSSNLRLGTKQCRESRLSYQANPTARVKAPPSSSLHDGFIKVFREKTGY